jgi:hypothetical protein
MLQKRKKTSLEYGQHVFDVVLLRVDTQKCVLQFVALFVVCSTARALVQGRVIEWQQ